MKKSHISILAIASVVAIISLCSFSIKGNGNVVKEDRVVEAYSGLDISSAFNVVIVQGDHYSLTVEADENLLPIIETKVKRGVLYISTKENIRKFEKMNIYLTFVDIDRMQISGAVDIESRGVINVKELNLDCSGATDVDLSLEVSTLRLDLSGASDIDLEGRCGMFVIDVSGASDLNAYDMKSNDVHIDASGASNVKVFAVSSIKADVSGASDVSYKGNPSTNDITTSGAGDVHKH